MLRPYLATQQMTNPAQIPGSFLTDCGREQHRSLCLDARLHDGLTEGDEGREAARVVGDAGSFEARTLARDGDVELRPEHGVEMGTHHQTRVSRVPFPEPRLDVPDFIDRDTVQAGIREERRDLRPTRAFVARRRGYRRQLGLALERGVIRALDVGARRADAGMGKQGIDHARKL